MPRRWYITRVAGTGADGDEYRTVAWDLGVRDIQSTVIPTDATGAPRRNFALVLVNAADFTALDASPDCDQLFPDNLDGLTVGDLPAARVARIANIASRIGAANLVPGEGILAPDVRLRRLVRRFTQALDPNLPGP